MTPSDKNIDTTDLENATSFQKDDLAAKDSKSGSDEETQEETSDVAGSEPNIIFVGNGEPLTKINDGMSTYKLPKVEDQADVKTIEGTEKVPETVEYTGKPFFHKNAGAIIQLFPDQYKSFVKKGS